ncbi:hypothetical protein EDD21DRAFT_376216 [Dissophora ornata]|nr:hypothetical protein EDD21DRAFT_376216 [Dissophora ornata]
MSTSILSLLGGVVLVATIAWCLTRTKKSPDSNSLIIPVSSNNSSATHRRPSNVIRSIHLSSSQQPAQFPVSDYPSQSNSWSMYNRSCPSRSTDQTGASQALASSDGESSTSQEPPPLYNRSARDATVLDPSPLVQSETVRYPVELPPAYSRSPLMSDTVVEMSSLRSPPTSLPSSAPTYPERAAASTLNQNTNIPAAMTTVGSA